VLHVHNGTAIETKLEDRNDEMRVLDAMLLIRIDDDSNRLVSSMDTAMAAVPHSLSFYAMVYKMTMKNNE
jgi:hypothetical protein